MTRAQLEHLVSSVGERSGWDFSRVRMESEPHPWEYDQVVRRYLRSTDRVLDVGTGGGERFLQLADAFAEGVGVDNDPEMVRTARRNRPDLLGGRIRFEVMDGRALTFGPDSFDVVLSRNVRFWPQQISRVVRGGGYFICQQVGEHMGQPIFDAFNWGTSGAHWRRVFADQGDPLPGREEDRAAFTALGCRVVATGHIENRAWFCDLPSLVFYLKAAPLPETFDPVRHWESFNRYLERAAGPRGYETHESWDLLVVRRPQAAVDETPHPPPTR